MIDWDNIEDEMDAKGNRKKVIRRDAPREILLTSNTV
jgi:hypothetical protein